MCCIFIFFLFKTRHTRNNIRETLCFSLPIVMTNVYSIYSVYLLTCTTDSGINRMYKLKIVKQLWIVGILSRNDHYACFWHFAPAQCEVEESPCEIRIFIAYNISRYSRTWATCRVLKTGFWAGPPVTVGQTVLRQPRALILSRGVFFLNFLNHAFLNSIRKTIDKLTLNVLSSWN